MVFSEQNRSARQPGDRRESGEGEKMMKLVATIVGAVLLVAGVGVAIVHYVLEGSFANSYITLALAAALLFVGWGLFDWGTGISQRWRGDKENGNGPTYPPRGDGM
jgi:hypothetical protein